jgi:hypothetical protein
MLMNASWRFADCANAIEGDLVRWEALGPAHICRNNRFPRSTLVSPTRLADRASMRGSITLDVVHVFTKNARILHGGNAVTRLESPYDTDFQRHELPFFSSRNVVYHDALFFLMRSRKGRKRPLLTTIWRDMCNIACKIVM